MADAPYAPRSPDLSAFHHSSSSAFYPQSHAASHPLDPFSVPTSHSNSVFYPSYPENALPDPYAFHQQQPQLPPQQQLPPQPQGRIRRQQSGVKAEQHDPSWFPQQQNPYAPILQMNNIGLKQEEVKCGPAPGEEEGIVVKTKFPVARIKRIVQADEDVGKVAQVTPLVVAKALELFMISLALKSADEARARNSKRVTAFHLKQAVQKDEQFDFLGEIVAKVPDAPTSSGKGKKDSEDDERDDEDEDVGATPAKRGRGAPKGRRGGSVAAAAGGGRRKRKEREDS